MGTEAEEHEKQTEGHILVEPGNLTGDRPFGENAGSYVLDRQQHNHACGDPRHAHLNRQTGRKEADDEEETARHYLSGTYCAG